ncbi:PREDICTED: plancitoxin-1, partial [Ceratosolen solmsi marchali]|uniref:Plancitoxin-1 n=1 Tax=Ceratosolen solmsi marchali TaxID=326594 RepID=A0AAJ7E2Y6_9HYME
LYKIPKIRNSNNMLIKEGVAYLYIDNNTFQNGWTLSKNNITSKTSIPGFTLAPIYDDKNSTNLFWLLYNDQPPNESVHFNYGHTKGVFVSNENEGFWLIHSVPNFPPQPNNGDIINKSRTKRNKNVKHTKAKQLVVGEYAYPSTGKLNGQSFLCISTNKTNFNTIGKQLMYNEIIVYKKNIPNYCLSQYSTLVDAAHQVHITNGSYNNKVNIYSKSGEKFTSFAKNSKWGKDLYDDFIAPQLNTDLYTETWLNGRGRLPSDCHRSKVLNIQSITLPVAQIQFKNTHDHSKWAASVESNDKNSWVCVGDINRASTQFERGGGSVCLNLPQVWKAYKNSVDNIEPCPIRNFKYYLDQTKAWFG